MISVIVPVFNVINYLERCVDSILKQTYTELEIILVDDGSTDGSGMLCDQLAQKDERIRVIHQPNARQAHARNHGIDEARGDYLLFIDSDDYISPDMCEIMLRQIESRPDISFVQCGMSIIEVDGTQTDNTVSESVLMTRDEAMEGFFSKRGHITASFSDKLIRRKVFENGLRLDEKIGNEDTEIIPRLIDASDKISIIDSTCYYYIKRENSTSSYNKFSLRIYGFLPSLLKFRDLCRDKYPTAYMWFDFYMANTLNGMYLYLLGCGDSYRYPGKKLSLRTQLFDAVNKCMHNPVICDTRMGELKEYKLRALLGDGNLKRIQRLMRVIR